MWLSNSSIGRKVVMSVTGSLFWVLSLLPDWLFILPISGTKCSLPKLSVFMI